MNNKEIIYEIQKQTNYVLLYMFFLWLSIVMLLLLIYSKIP